ncbi:MAG TPA: VWA domain-containing protein [Gemmatimonadaceae bacterium]
MINLIDFPTIDFAAPYVLLLLLLIPLWWIWRRRRRAPAIVFSRSDVLARGRRGGAFTRRLLGMLRMLLLVGLIVALARPRSGAHTENVDSQGINIVIAIDLSSSMLSEDFQPQNRLEVAKDKVKQFILGRHSDRIGLVAFAGEALTQVPLTVDYPVLLAAVDNLQAGQLEDGTAIGTAIATAANRLRDAPGHSRVLILLTDGENNRGAIDPRTAAQAAAAVGVKIYTIGAGTIGMAPVPVGRGLMGMRYEYRPVEIDEGLLRDVASTTGGRYFRAVDAAALQRIYQQIDQLEQEPVRAHTYVRYTEEYRWPLALALIAITFEALLSVWRGPLP